MRTATLLASVIAALSMGTSFAGDKVIKIDCGPVADATEKAVRKDPDKVLDIVAKDSSANPDCVCPIIKAAIAGAQANEDLQKQIIASALNAVPEKAAEIKACLPESAVVMGSGKEPIGKKHIVEEKPVEPVKGDSDDIFLPYIGGPGTIGASGVYLSSPGTGGSTGEEQVLITTVRLPPRIIKKEPSGPVTKS
jgi:hypothetical protein